MTASELHDLLVKRLLKTWGGNKRRWQMALGRVTVHDRSTHAHCNWSVTPSGTTGENAAIEQLLDDIRIQFPFVVAG
jgi:hypothetical protein